MCFGCSVIGEKYIKKFDNKILNIHLGLSPFYRGQATNFWAFVNNELQFIGATFHKIDADIDTGPIIHQIRGRIYKNDNIHLIGNRLIKDLKLDLIKIVLNFENLKSIKKKIINQNILDQMILMTRVSISFIITIRKKLF